MNSTENATRVLKDKKLDVKIKLSGLWITIIFLFIYVDHFSLFEPDIIENIMAGEITGFQIDQVWLLSAMILMMVPSVMIFLSLILKAKWNRWVNIVVGALYILVVLGNIIGESWIFYLAASIVEVVLLALIVWYAWNWPKQQNNPEEEYA